MMVLHRDFQMIREKFMSSFGDVHGSVLFQRFIKEKGLNSSQPIPRRKEIKEFRCNVVGFEIKEDEKSFHVEGLIATTHIDNADEDDGIGIPDRIPKETLESFANQINTIDAARRMGTHHSEGSNQNKIYQNWIQSIGASDLVSDEPGREFFGRADVSNNPAIVIDLADGEHGLYVDTQLLKKDPMTPNIIEGFHNGHFNSFSITYQTDGFQTTDFEREGDGLVRVLLPETQLAGYTAASHPVNPHAVATAFGFKEFKELVVMDQLNLKEVKQMSEEDVNNGEDSQEDSSAQNEPSSEADAGSSDNGDSSAASGSTEETSEEEVTEQKEFKRWKADRKKLEEKELMEKTAGKIAASVVKKMEVKEKVLKDNEPKDDETKVSFELKEFKEAIDSAGKLEIKEQFRRAAAYCDSINLDWESAKTSAAESREYKSFGVNGTNLEYKALGITTNQNTDTDYLQSSAELQDIYDPIIYNALNQVTVTWNLLAKDDFSSKGNNQVQFTLKTAANTTAAFYTGNAVATGNVTRLKYQTKFKKLQVGVSVDGDMIAAARGGPVSDVFAQEVMDSTMDMLSVLNVALFAEVGLETASGVIGFEYIADSAGNTSLYNLTRSAANKLAPDSAGDTYIDQGATIVSMTNLRSGIRQAVIEGSFKRNLVYITSPTQGDLMRGKFDDSRRMLKSTDTDFGFSTDLFIDGVPVFEDKDCNTDDWFLIDLESHRVGIWIPPTIERLGKSADSEDAFIKMYLATYNRRPRSLVQIFNCATS